MQMPYPRYKEVADMAKGKFSQPRSGKGENDRLRSGRAPIETEKTTSAKQNGNLPFRRMAEDVTAPLPDFPEDEIPGIEPDDRFLSEFNDRLSEENSEDTQMPRFSDIISQEPAPAESEMPPFPEAREIRFQDDETEFEDDGSEDTGFLDKMVVFLESHRTGALIGLCSAVAVLIIGIILALVLGGNSDSDPYGKRILNNVTVAGVNVGGMSRSEAVLAVQRATQDTFTKKDMVIQLPDETITLSPQDTGVDLDVEGAVDAAYAYGRTGTKEEQQQAYQSSLTGNHTIGLFPYLNLNETYIRNTLNSYAEKYSDLFTPSGYTLEGDQPNLEEETFNASAPCQTLVLTLGTPGLGADMNSLYDRILDAYSLNQFLVEVTGMEEGSAPEPLDLDAIYQAVYIAPVPRSIDKESYETIPGAYGYGFNLEQAKQLLASSQYGDVLRIPMEYISPDSSGNDSYFQDVLGSCETPHTDNENRNTNLRLVCQTLNGLIIQPGATFSYNETLGERTAEKGYKPAPAYSGYNLKDTIGGGICQGSSTLYWCAMLADLEIVDRINHGYPASYMDKGLDATVSWNGPDFKFRNNTDSPIKILAEVSGGYLKMQIMGTDHRDYYIKMKSVVTATNKPETVYEEHGPDEGFRDGEVLTEGKNGYYVKTYRCKYDKQTDALISEDFEVLSSYLVRNEVVVRIVGTATATPVPEPPAPTEGSTEPPAPTAAPTAPPETQPAPPETQPAPPETQPAPPETQPAPPETQPAPPETQTTPPETQPAPQPEPQPEPPAQDDTDTSQEDPPSNTPPDTPDTPEGAPEGNAET